MIKYHFLDSGAFTLATKAQQKAIDMKTFYDSEKFYRYIDSYAAFIKKYSLAIHFYANLDVIGNPELTWRNQQYLEKEHGLKPVPVVHFGTEMKWLLFYLERYDFIGLGGLVGAPQPASTKWLDMCFDIICSTPNRLPCVKIHGFGVTGLSRLMRYPWYSVDSTSWARVAGLGQIYVPRKTKGEFDFLKRPIIVPISQENPTVQNGGGHFLSFSAQEKKAIIDWLDYIQIPLGDKDTPGVCNHSGSRRRANLYFFDMLAKEVSKHERPFYLRKKGLLL